MHVDLATYVVRDYDAAIAFFTDVLGFVVTEDEPSLTNDGRPKRWVVVRPPNGGTGLLLARVDGPEQERSVGNQAGGRVTFFLRVDDVVTLIALALLIESFGRDIVWQFGAHRAVRRSQPKGIAPTRTPTSSITSETTHARHNTFLW